MNRDQKFEQRKDRHFVDMLYLEESETKPVSKITIARLKNHLDVCPLRESEDKRHRKMSQGLVRGPHRVFLLANDGAGGLAQKRCDFFLEKPACGA